MREIEFWGTSPEVEARVSEFFAAGRLRRRRLRTTLDEDGSVRLAHPTASGRQLKISGASHEHAVAAYETTRQLAAAGVDAVPCVGFGRARTTATASWFALFEVDPRWRRADPPTASMPGYAASLQAAGQLILDVAVNHRLLGSCWYVIGGDGGRVVDAGHTFRSVDPLTTSPEAWARELLTSLGTLSATAHRLQHSAEIPAGLADLRLFPFRALFPEVTAADCDAVGGVVAAGEAELRMHPIGRAALAACPSGFGRGLDLREAVH